MSHHSVSLVLSSQQINGSPGTLIRLILALSILRYASVPCSVTHTLMQSQASKLQQESSMQFPAHAYCLKLPVFFTLKCSFNCQICVQNILSCCIGSIPLQWNIDTSHMIGLQADSGIRARPSSQPEGDQKFDFGAFIKGDLPKKLLIMLVGASAQG